MPTEALLEVNVVIAAIFADHVAHERARHFVGRINRFATSPTIQGGFLRFATRPWKNERKEEQPPRLSMAVAMDKLREFTAVDGHFFVPDDQPFLHLGLRSMQGHRQWTDAYLLHLARCHGMVLASLESRMSNLDDPATPRAACRRVNSSREDEPLREPKISRLGRSLALPGLARERNCALVAP